MSCLRRVLDENPNTRDLIVGAILVQSHWPKHVGELMGKYSEQFKTHTLARKLLDSLPTRKDHNKRKLEEFELNNLQEEQKRQRRETNIDNDRSARQALSGMGLSVQPPTKNKTLTVKQLRDKIVELITKAKSMGAPVHDKVLHTFKGASRARKADLVSMIKHCYSIPELACGIIEEVDDIVIGGGEEEEDIEQAEEIVEAEEAFETSIAAILANINQ